MDGVKPTLVANCHVEGAVLKLLGYIEGFRQTRHNGTCGIIRAGVTEVVNAGQTYQEYSKQQIKSSL